MATDIDWHGTLEPDERERVVRLRADVRRQRRHPAKTKDIAPDGSYEKRASHRANAARAVVRGRP